MEQHHALLDTCCLWIRLINFLISENYANSFHSGNISTHRYQWRWAILARYVSFIDMWVCGWVNCVEGLATSLLRPLSSLIMSTHHLWRNWITLPPSSLSSTSSSHQTSLVFQAPFVQFGTLGWWWYSMRITPTPLMGHYPDPNRIVWLLLSLHTCIPSVSV